MAPEEEKKEGKKKKKREPLPPPPPPPPSRTGLILVLLLLLGSAGVVFGVPSIRAKVLAALGLAKAETPPPPPPAPPAPPPPPVVPPPAPPVALPPPPPPAPPAEPEDDGKGPRGWFNEKLPDRLKEGKEKPLYLWDTGHGFEIELVYVPPGDFIMGSDDPEAYEDEKPKHKHPMPRGYWIGRTNLSWKEYMPFCEETKREKPPRPPWAEDDHPVISVSWDDSKAFCDWAGVVLPTEAEWEKAARGTDGRKFPWGDEFDANKLNAQNRVGHTTPGNAFPEGASPYGVLDIEGNVWQWCAEWYEQRAYDRYKRGDVKLLETGSDRAWRGSRWRDTNSTALGGKFDEKASQATCRVSVRGGHEPWMHDVCQGFRVAVRNEPKADKGASQPEKKD